MSLPPDSSNDPSNVEEEQVDEVKTAQSHARSGTEPYIAQLINKVVQDVKEITGGLAALVERQIDKKCRSQVKRPNIKLLERVEQLGPPKVDLDVNSWDLAKMEPLEWESFCTPIHKYLKDSNELIMDISKGVKASRGDERYLDINAIRDKIHLSLESVKVSHQALQRMVSLDHRGVTQLRLVAEAPRSPPQSPSYSYSTACGLSVKGIATLSTCPGTSPEKDLTLNGTGTTLPVHAGSTFISKSVSVNQSTT